MLKKMLADAFIKTFWLIISTIVELAIELICFVAHGLVLTMFAAPVVFICLYIAGVVSLKAPIIAFAAVFLGLVISEFANSILDEYERKKRHPSRLL